MKRIPSAGPSITELEIKYVNEAIRTGWGDKMRYYIDAFEDEFSNYVGCKFCLTTSHCTDSIHLALLSLDIGPGDEVIVPDLTWVASASPILSVGAIPRFVDVDINSWCITAKDIEEAITYKTKAVIVVDLLGNTAEWDEIIDLCKKHNIYIIEDAAEGLGATYKNKQAGTFGDISVFSFNATKLIMSGQGGAFCTSNEELYKKAKLLSHHGIDKENTGRYYWSTSHGYNYNWTNIQAALALAQLRRIEDLIDYKIWLFNEYKSRLISNEFIVLNSASKNINPTYWISTAIISPESGHNKESLLAHFENTNIDLRPLFYPLSSMPLFSEFNNTINQNTEYLSRQGICLPNGNNLNLSDIRLISRKILEALENESIRTI